MNAPGRRVRTGSWAMALAASTLWFVPGCQPSQPQREQRAIDAVGLGRRHAERGELEEAVAAYSEAIRLNPKSADAYDGRATAYEILDDLDRAILDRSEVIRLEPDDPQAYAERALLYLKQGAQDKADADLATVRELRLNQP